MPTVAICRKESPTLHLKCGLSPNHKGPHMRGSYLWKEDSQKEVRNLSQLLAPVFLGHGPAHKIERERIGEWRCEDCGYPVKAGKKYCRFHASHRNGLLMARREAWRIRVHKEHKEVIVHGGKFTANRWKSARQPSCDAVT